MASLAALRPFPIRIQTDLDRMVTPESVTPVQHRYSAQLPSSLDSPTSSASPTPTRTSHYRPFSTLLTHSPYIEHSTPHNSKRSSSSGGFQALQMGLHFKAKQEHRYSQVSEPTCPPLLHSSTAPAPNTQNSTGSSHTSGVKKKKSIVSLFSSPAETSPSAERTPVTPSNANIPSPTNPSYPPSPRLTEIVEKPVPYKVATLPVSISFRPSSAIERFVPKNIWAKRHKMKLHPYQKDVPYMQAYDPVLLESDRYTDFLLQRLTNGSPSFYDYGATPPSTVLDLGCGPGYWIIHAANVWQRSNFTGFDLVDVTLPDIESAENIHFVQGDFLNYRLPFPNKFFEYVRMANLVLCVPHDKWEQLLTEVQRVLAPGGRLELIDDEIYFPYGEPPKDSPSPPSGSGFDDSDDEDHLDDEKTLHDEDSESTLHGSSDGSRPSSFDEPAGIYESSAIRSISQYLPPTPSCAEPAEREFALPISTKRRNSLSNSPIPSPGSPLFTDVADRREPRSTTWQKQAVASRNVEKVFKRMLSEAYGIQPKSGDYIMNALHQLFGKEKAGKSKSFHVKLAPLDSPIGAVGRIARGKGVSRSQDDVLDITTGDDVVPKSTPLSSSPESKDNPASSITSPPKKRKPWDRKAKKEKKAPLLKGVKAMDLSKEEFPQFTVTEPSPELPRHGLSAKAAGRLGISYSVLAAATAKSIHTRRSSSGSDSTGFSPVQHPGILVWPSTYLPMGAAELEMHACKYMHTLLGCRPAMSEFVGKHVDQDGSRWVGEDEFREEMWEYECFRRSRFNWPSEVADPEDDPTNRNAYSLDSPTLRSASGSSTTSNGSTGSLEAPQMMKKSISAGGTLTTTPQSSTTKASPDVFAKAKTLRSTKSSMLLRSSPKPSANSSQSISHSAFTSARKMLPLSSSSSPAPSLRLSPSPPHSRGNSIEADVNFNGQYHRNELVHLRTIRVFEAVKPHVHDRPGTPDSF